MSDASFPVIHFRATVKLQGGGEDLGEDIEGGECYPVQRNLIEFPANIRISCGQWNFIELPLDVLCRYTNNKI